MRLPFVHHKHHTRAASPEEPPAINEPDASHFAGLRAGLAALVHPTVASRGHASAYQPPAGGRPGSRDVQATSSQFRRVSSTWAPNIQGAPRKSDLWTQSRMSLEDAIEEEKQAARSDWDDDLLEQEERLQQRLDKLKLQTHVSGSDGACQFRSVSFGLWGCEDYHKAVRKRAVQHMAKHRQEFEPYVGELDFEAFLQEMSDETAWGDELTLRAICDTYGVLVNVLSSDQHNWHMRYEPHEQKVNKELWLSFIAPIHYNAIRRQSSQHSAHGGRAQQQQLRQQLREQQAQAEVDAASASLAATEGHTAGADTVDPFLHDPTAEALAAEQAPALVTDSFSTSGTTPLSRSSAGSGRRNQVFAAEPNGLQQSPAAGRAHAAAFTFADQAGSGPSGFTGGEGSLLDSPMGSSPIQTLPTPFAVGPPQQQQAPAPVASAMHTLDDSLHQLEANLQ